MTQENRGVVVGGAVTQEYRGVAVGGAVTDSYRLILYILNDLLLTGIVRGE